MDTVTVVSIAPYKTRRKQREEHPVALEVPVKPDNAPYGALTVKGGNATKDFGEGQRMPIPVSALDLAQDLVRGVEEHGVFIAAGEKPTKEELAEASERRRQFNIKTVDEADSIWARTGDRKQLPFHASFAVKELGLRREWAMDVSAMEPCPACRELIQKGAFTCGKCHAVLDPQKAADFGMLSPDKLEYYKSRGMVATLKAPKKGE
jgi:hypothetical protein